MKVERRFLGLMAVSNQAAQEIDTEIERATMTGVFDLGDVLELIGNRLDDGAAAQQQLVGKQHQAVVHVGSELGDELHALLKQVGKGGLRQVALVAEQLAPQPLR